MSVNKALVDKFLTNVSQKYEPKGLIADMILPKLVTKQSTGKIGKYGLGHLRIENAVMGGRGQARRVEVRQYLSDAYFVKPHGLEDWITPEEYANVELPFDVERDTTKMLTLALALGKEKAIADTLRDTSIITQNATLSGTSQWSDYVNSDPVVDIKTAKGVARGTSGVVVDTLIADWLVIETLRYHPKLVRSLGFADNRAGQLSEAEIAKALGLRKILVADVMYNSAKEGQTEALGNLWGKDAILAVCPDSAALEQKSLGYRVVSTDVGDGIKVYKQPVVNPPGAKSIIVKDAYDMVLTDVKCAYLYKTAIA